MRLISLNDENVKNRRNLSNAYHLVVQVRITNLLSPDLIACSWMFSRVYLSHVLIILTTREVYIVKGQPPLANFLRGLGNGKFITD